MSIQLSESKKRLNIGIGYYECADYAQAYQYFEDAHILGQRDIWLHTLSHWWMLRVAIKAKDMGEFFGQIPRIFASLVFSKIWVPVGNSGRVAVSAIKPMPIPQHLQSFFDD